LCIRVRSTRIDFNADRKGWSQRKIARELQIDRETVARYRRLAKAGEAAKPANPPAGSDPASLEQPPESKPAIPPTGWTNKKLRPPNQMGLASNNQ